jgi:hypothetical protein
MKYPLTHAKEVLCYLFFGSLITTRSVVTHYYNSDLVISRVWRNNTGVFFRHIAYFSKSHIQDLSKDHLIIFNGFPQNKVWINLSYIQKHIYLANFLILQYYTHNLLGKRRGS